jgi:hypothetical protein
MRSALIASISALTFGWASAAALGATLSTSSLAPSDLAQPAPPHVDDDLVLSQNTTTTIGPQAVACTDPFSGAAFENSFYRRFVFSDHGVTSPFSVTSVAVGIEVANSPSGQQPMSVRLHAIGVDLPLANANLTLIAQADVSLPDQSFSIVPVPISATVATPTAQDLVVEVFEPDHSTTGGGFYVGANTDPETRPGYIRAPQCGISEPTTFAAVGFPNNHIVLTVSGHLAATDVLTTGERAAALLLDGAFPNPTRGGDLRVQFSLPVGQPASLELIDVAGRRLVSEWVGSRGTGVHRVDLGAGRRFAAGVYLIRLTQGDQSVTRRVVLVD